VKQTKIWGTTNDLFFKNNVEVHRIEIVKGGFCSKHRHEYKFNMFFVESGELEIGIWTNEGMIDKTILKAGEQSAVPPNVYHKFTANEDTIAYEIYWTELSPSDIIRETVGGIE